MLAKNLSATSCLVRHHVAKESHPQRSDQLDATKRQDIANQQPQHPQDDATRGFIHSGNPNTTKLHDSSSKMEDGPQVLCPAPAQRFQHTITHVVTDRASFNAFE